MTPPPLRTGPVAGSRHFDWREFSVSASHPALVEPIPAVYEKYVEQLVRGILHAARVHVARSLRVLSCYRSKALNDAADGSRTSQHRRAQAADVTTGDWLSVERLFLDLLTGGLGPLEGRVGQVIVYPGQCFVHVALPSPTYPKPSFHVHWPARGLRYTRVSSVSAYRSLTR